jgi:hypothetical protein
MTTKRIALVLAVLVALACVAARHVARDEGERARAEEGVEAQAHDPVPHDWSGARALSSRGGSDARAVRALDGGVEEVIVAPTRAEAGPLEADFTRLRAERIDPAASSRVQGYVHAMLAQHRVEASAVAVTCTRSLCRVRLGFDSEEELHPLADIPHEAARMRIGAPSIEGDVATLVAYWDRDATEATPF